MPTITEPNRNRTTSGTKLMKAAHRALNHDNLSPEHLAILAEAEAEIEKAVRRLERVLNR